MPTRKTNGSTVSAVVGVGSTTGKTCRATAMDAEPTGTATVVVGSSAPAQSPVATPVVGDAKFTG